MLKESGSGTVEILKLSIAKPGCSPENTRVSNSAAEILMDPWGNRGEAIPTAVDVASNAPLGPPRYAFSVTMVLTNCRLFVPKSQDAESKNVEKTMLIGNPVPFSIAFP